MFIVPALGVLTVVTACAYFLFKDIINRVQYIESLRLYWIVKDDAVRGAPFHLTGFMRQTAAPFWRGKGHIFHIGTYSIQIGTLMCKVDSLEAQITNLGWLDTETKVIRKWQ